MNDRRCATCAEWSEGAYANTQTEDGRDYGKCLHSYTEDGMVAQGEPMVIGEGCWGENYAATHPDHVCRNWRICRETQPT